MSDEQQSVDTGSKDRATVALVYRAVDDLGKIVDAHFETVKLQLSALAFLPTRVDRLDKVAEDHGRRLDAIENDDQSQLTRKQQRRAYRTGPLVLIVIAVASIAVNAVVALIAAHVI